MDRFRGLGAAWPGEAAMKLQKKVASDRVWG